MVVCPRSWPIALLTSRSVARPYRTPCAPVTDPASPPHDGSAVQRAADVLRNGGLVAFPTETVYGLGADAENPVAVTRVFAVKGRPRTHPVIVHLADAGQIDDWAVDVSPVAHQLASAFWPGPLTLIVHRSERVPDEVTGGRSTVGLRVPAHPVALALLKHFGGALAAPSANRFGRTSPTTAQHVLEDLGTDVDFILDGGDCAVGVESTIVDTTVDPPVILRPGGVSSERISARLGTPIAHDVSGPARAPGMLASHYAPRCDVEIIETSDLARQRVAELRRLDQRVELLDPQVDGERWAHGLYRWLREADRRGARILVVVPPPLGGAGTAVRDRLARAAAHARSA